MALITLTIEDIPGGQVRVVTNPTVEKVMLMAKAGALESSHGYMFAALNAIRKESQSKQPSLIKIPRIIAN
jgi:hypothetical protein